MYVCVCLSEAEQIHKAHTFAERLASENPVNSQSVSSGSGSRLAVWRIAAAVCFSVALRAHKTIRLIGDGPAAI